MDKSIDQLMDALMNISGGLKKTVSMNSWAIDELHR